MLYKLTHARSSALVRAATRGGVIAAAAAITVAGIVAGTASADTYTYSQNGNYQFASDSFDYNGNAGDYIVTGGVQSHSDSSQVLGADGVDLTAAPGGSNYADSGVIVDLGPLSKLVASDGTYTAPVIKGSSNLAVNYYFGTNGSTSSFGTLNGSGVLTSADGNNYAAMGPASGSLNTPDWSNFSSYNGTDTAFTQLDSTTTMAGAAQAYQAESGSEGVQTADPEVWAWIGVVSTADGTAVSGNVESVNGTNLVTTTDTTPPPTYTAALNGAEGVVQNAHSGKYLNVSASTYATGSKLVQWGSGGASHEKFEVVTVTGSDGSKAGYLEAVGPNGNYLVTASGGGQLTLGAVAPASLADAKSATFAKSLQSGGSNASADMLKSGSYYTFPNDGGYVMDDSGQSTANGAKIIAYAKNGGKNQQWSLP